jgi:hypothetical protein
VLLKSLGFRAVKIVDDDRFEISYITMSLDLTPGLHPRTENSQVASILPGKMFRSDSGRCRGSESRDGAAFQDAAYFTSFRTTQQDLR